MSLARKLYDIFFEGCTHYSVAKVNDSGNLAYYSTVGVPSLDLIEQHLKGETILGAYTVLPGNFVRWMAWDVDCKDDPDGTVAKDLARRLCDFLGGISYVIEWSGNKGYHIIIFFKNPVPAAQAKALGEEIRDVLGFAKTGDPHVEVFPKQEKLTESNPLGNLLRLPLGKHPTTGSWTIFVDPYNGWETGPEKDSESLLDFRVEIRELQALLDDTDPITKLIKLLQPYWTSGQRHNMALYTAGYLATSGWTREAVEEVIKELDSSSGEGDLDNQLECVEDTFERVSQGKSVIGFQGLSDILPSSVLRKVTDLAASQTYSAILQVVDRIRLGKGAQFQKVRSSAKTIIGYLKENGRLVQDDNWVYWLDSTTKNLLSLGSPGWDLYCHTHFGLNPLESFGKQVAESVRLYAQEEAAQVKVYKRSYWDGERLLLNLGGPEVYILTGDPSQRSMVYNGEIDILFLNSEDPMRLPNLFEESVPTLSPWPFLVDDLSFLSGENVSASAEQQKELLKAWIVSIFFAQTMPTRPILTILASSGAGKTTTARRILRLLEGPDEDVLGVVSDKPDSLRSSLAVHKVLALDNLEKTKAHWLPDVLNRVSTGSHIEIRTLYKTNDVQKIIPDCFVIITATDMPFSEETVFTRMLPIQLAQLVNPKPEYQMQLRMLDNYEALWKGLIVCLEEVVRELKVNHTVEAPTESRLADFTVFCRRIQNCSFLVGHDLMEGLSSLVFRQRQALQKSSPFMQVLEMWLNRHPDDAENWRSMSDLFSLLKKFANDYRMGFYWSSAQGLSRHVSAMEELLVRYHGMETRSVKEQNREVNQYRFKKTSVTVE